MSKPQQNTESNEINVSDLLMKKYSLLREEVMFYLQLVKSQVKYLQIFIAGFLVILWYIFSNISAELSAVKALEQYGVSTELIILMVMLSITTACLYLILDISDSFCGIFIAAARLYTIEEELNRLAGRRILIWETQAQIRHIGHWIFPRRLLRVVQVTIIAFFSVVIPEFFYLQLWQKGWHPIMVFIAAFYTVACFCLSIYAYHYSLHIVRPRTLKRMQTFLENKAAQA